MYIPNYKYFIKIPNIFENFSILRITKGHNFFSYFFEKILETFFLGKKLNIGLC